MIHEAVQLYPNRSGRTLASGQCRFDRPFDGQHGHRQSGIGGFPGLPEPGCIEPGLRRRLDPGRSERISVARRGRRGLCAGVRDDREKALDQLADRFTRRGHEHGRRSRLAVRGGFRARTQRPGESGTRLLQLHDSDRRRRGLSVDESRLGRDDPELRVQEGGAGEAGIRIAGSRLRDVGATRGVDRAS